jgi:hypothetical protein
MPERIVRADVGHRQPVRLLVALVIPTFLTGAYLTLAPSVAAGAVASRDATAGVTTTFQGSCSLTRNSPWDGRELGFANGTCTGSVNGGPEQTIADAGVSYTATSATLQPVTLGPGAVVTAPLVASGTGHLSLNTQCRNQGVPCPEIPFTFTEVATGWLMEDGSGGKAVGTNQAAAPSAWLEGVGGFPPNGTTFALSFSTIGALSGTN